MTGTETRSEARSDRPRAAIVYNPLSGGGHARDVSSRVEARLAEVGYHVDRAPTRNHRGAAAVALELTQGDSEAGGGVDRVVVVGGDGTLRETFEGLGPLARRLPVAIVPTGNANIVATELGIGTDVDEAIETAIRGRPTPMDVGVVRADAEESLFLAVVGVGWDAHTVRMLDRVRRTEAGRLSYRIWADGLYAVSGLAAALRPRQERFSASVDDAPLDGTFCAAWVCNLRTYGKGMSVTPDAHRSSGELHLHLRRKSAPPYLMAQLTAAVLSRHAPPSVSTYGSGARVRLDGEKPLAVQVDGDDFGWRRTLELSVSPAAVTIVAPYG